MCLHAGRDLQRRGQDDEEHCEYLCPLCPPGHPGDSQDNAPSPPIPTQFLCEPGHGCAFYPGPTQTQGESCFSALWELPHSYPGSPPSSAPKGCWSTEGRESIGLFEPLGPSLSSVLAHGPLPVEFLRIFLSAFPFFAKKRVLVNNTSFLPEPSSQGLFSPLQA